MRLLRRTCAVRDNVGSRWVACLPAATCALVRRTVRRSPGSTARACTSSWALSVTRRQRNHVKKTVGLPYAGNRTYGLKGGWGTGSALRAPRPSIPMVGGRDRLMSSRMMVAVGAASLMVAASACGGSGESASRPPSGSTTITTATLAPTSTTVVSTPSVAVPQDARASMFVTGNASPHLEAGQPGVVALLTQGSQLDQGGSLPIVVRNNTSVPVERITASATIQDSSGKLIASG
jgi:hypothetical protein